MWKLKYFLSPRWMPKERGRSHIIKSWPRSPCATKLQLSASLGDVRDKGGDWRKRLPGYSKSIFPSPPWKGRILVVDFNSIFLGTWESLCKWTRCQFTVKDMCALLQILLDAACPQRPTENTKGHMCPSSAKRILGLPGRVKRWREFWEGVSLNLLKLNMLCRKAILLSIFGDQGRNLLRRYVSKRGHHQIPLWQKDGHVHRRNAKTMVWMSSNKGLRVLMGKIPYSSSHK